MSRFALFFLFCFAVPSLPTQSWAGLDLSVSYSSTTSGRTMPSLNAGYVFSGWRLGGASGGVQTSVYYESDYLLTAQSFSEFGELFWGKVRGGFGGGLYYGERGYRSSVSNSVQKATEWTVGPALRVEMDLFGPSFLFVESLYGIRNLGMMLLLSFQDVSYFGIGARL